MKHLKRKKRDKKRYKEFSCRECIWNRSKYQYRELNFRTLRVCEEKKGIDFAPAWPLTEILKSVQEFARPESTIFTPVTVCFFPPVVPRSEDRWRTLIIAKSMPLRLHHTPEAWDDLRFATGATAEAFTLKPIQCEPDCSRCHERRKIDKVI